MKLPTAEVSKRACVSCYRTRSGADLRGCYPRESASVRVRLSANQNMYFSPNWIWRMLVDVDVTTPKF